NMVNPGASYSNVFAGQLMTLAITLGFDNAIPSFSSNTIHIKDLYYNGGGTFNGWTVQQIFNAANAKIGGCASPYTASALSDVLDVINNNYDDGTSDHGHLQCSPVNSGAARTDDETTVTMSENVIIKAYPNPFSVSSSIEFTLTNDDNVTLEVYTVTGV